jgi:hypothetical protein
VGKSGKLWITYIRYGKRDKKLSFRIVKMITIKRYKKSTDFRGKNRDLLGVIFRV